MFISVIFLCLSLTLGSNNAERLTSVNENKIKLIIDNDAGSDDAMAIFLALLSEKYFDGPQLVALTTVNGNTNEENVNINNQRILKVANRQDVPIYRGSEKSLVFTPNVSNFHGVDGMGDAEEIPSGLTSHKETHAVQALLELSTTYEGDLIVVTLGAVTNIALAITLDPGFLGRLKHLYVAAGHVHSSKYPDPEFNAHMDTESYHIITEAATPDKVTVSPYSQTKEYLDIEKEWRQDVLGAIDTDIIKAQNKYETIGITRNDKWYALDPSTVAVILNPNLIQEVGFVRNSIKLCGEDRGIVSNKIDVNSQKANMRLIYSIKKIEYQQFLLDVFSAELKTRTVKNI